MRDTVDQDALKVIHLRNHFYRDNYRKLMIALVFGFMTIFMLVAALAYLVIYPPSPRYFAVSEAGHIVPLVPMGEPNLDDAALLDWTSRAVVRAFNFNFVNYRDALNSLKDDFTESGWKSFVDAFNDSNNLEAVLQKKLVVSAIPTGVPVIVEQGLKDGTYIWRVQMPLLVTYESSSESISQPFQIDILVTRVSTLRSAHGISIQQLIQRGSGSVRV